MNAPEEVLYGLDEDALENDYCFLFSRRGSCFSGVRQTPAQMRGIAATKTSRGGEHKLDRDIDDTALTVGRPITTVTKLHEAHESCQRRFGDDWHDHHDNDHDYDRR